MPLAITRIRICTGMYDTRACIFLDVMISFSLLMYLYIVCDECFWHGRFCRANSNALKFCLAAVHVSILVQWWWISYCMCTDTFHTAAATYLFNLHDLV
jgi:hypothetical protein